MSPDPAGEYASPYVYVGNNPLRLADPTGMFSADCGSYADCTGSGGTGDYLRRSGHTYEDEKVKADPPDDGPVIQHPGVTVEAEFDPIWLAKALAQDPERFRQVLLWGNKHQQEAAVIAAVYAGGATSLKNAAIFAGNTLSVASALTGVGVGALGVRMMFA